MSYNLVVYPVAKSYIQHSDLRCVLRSMYYANRIPEVTNINDCVDSLAHEISDCIVLVAESNEGRALVAYSVPTMSAACPGRGVVIQHCLAEGQDPGLIPKLFKILKADCKAKNLQWFLTQRRVASHQYLVKYNRIR